MKNQPNLTAENGMVGRIVGREGVTDGGGLGISWAVNPKSNF